MHVQRRTALVGGGAGPDATQAMATQAMATQAMALLRRSSGSDKKTAVIVIVAILVVLTATAFLLLTLASCHRRRRRRQRRGQKTPGPDQGRGIWNNIVRYWPSSAGRYQQARSHDGPAPADGQGRPLRLGRAPPAPYRNAELGRGPQADQSSSSPRAAANRPPAAAANVPRNASIRSVMTFPPYRPMASSNEEVLGREGDRDGIDTIIDLHTAEDDEVLCEQEMDTLYQIRVARRQHLAQRDELRRQRSGARRQNDGQALAEMGARSRAASNNQELDHLRREVGRIHETRQRSVSSVEYADLGVARHDGTRIRANSSESERMGLLSDAASMAVSHRSGDPSLRLHRRDPSTSSLVSVDSDLATLARPRGAVSRSATPRPASGGAGAGSGPAPVAEADLGDETMPPPEYDDVALDDDDSDDDDDELSQSTTTPPHHPPPGYSGPYRPAQTQRGETGAQRTGRGVGGAPQLPSLRISRLPAIVIESSSEQHGDS